MSDHNLADSNAPVEIWIAILQHYLGPSLTSPIHSSLLDYEKRVFVDDEALLRIYARKERKRGTLRLVSRSWKRIADQLGDRIAFICLEKDFRLPPHCDMSSVKLIYYLSPTSETYIGSLPEETRDAQRYNLAVEPSPSMRVVADYTSVASITHIDGLHIIFSNEPPPADSAHSLGPLLAFRWIYPVMELDALETLYRHQFHFLVALEVSFSGEQPYRVRPELCLPNLRCLSVKSAASTLDILVNWWFPALQYCSVLHDYTPTMTHLATFIQRHFETITDLKLSTYFSGLDIKDESDILASCKNGLPRLNVYTTQSLFTLDSILPQLFRLLDTSYRGSTSSGRHLIVRLTSACVRPQHAKESEAALFQIKKASARIKLEMEDTWGESTRQLAYRQYSLLIRRRFTYIVDRLDAPVSDSDGYHWNSQAARRYAFEVQRMLDDLQRGGVEERYIRDDDWE